MKNPSTKRRGRCASCTRAQTLALTGTPVENQLVELWAILDAVDPGAARQPRPSFREQYAGPIERDARRRGRRRAARADPTVRAAAHEGRPALLPDLPDKIEQIACGHTHPRAGDAVPGGRRPAAGRRQRPRGHAVAAGSVLAALDPAQADLQPPGARARRRLAPRRALGQARPASTSSSRSCSTSANGRSCSRSSARWASCCRRHLARPARARRAVPPRRRAEDGARPDGRRVPGRRRCRRCCSCRCKAGGTGLNLTAAQQVIHYDRWWNPAVEDQATDRAWRIGQQRTVNVHKLVCQGTVEERIGELIDEKRALANARGRRPARRG